MTKMKIITLAGAVVAAAVLGLGPVPSAFAHTDLRVVNFGGAQGRSHMLAFVRPWEQSKQKFVDMVEYNGGIEELRKQVESANVKWDVVDMEYSDLIRACEAGLLVKFDHSTLPPAEDGTSAKEDFHPDAFHECGVGSVIWATVFAYNKSRYPGSGPQTIADFFDVKKFPGKRGLRRDPRGALEWALMADGVPADQVYSTLGTPDGVDRAFEVLSGIKPFIVWWESGPEPAQLLEEGRVVMTAAWNGRLYRPIKEQGRDIEIVWDGQLWEIEVFGIPKGSRRLQNALDFVRFATGTRPLLNQTNYISYGPVRKSSQALVSFDIEPLLPTSEKNMNNALRSNAVWWATNLDAIQARFDEWAKPALSEIQQRGARF